MSAGRNNSKTILGLGLVCLISGAAIYLTYGQNVDSAPPSLAVPANVEAEVDTDPILIPGGTYLIGSDTGPRDTRPARSIHLTPFRIDRTEVTNAMFAEFVQATGYQTDAERRGYSLCFDETSRQFTRQDGANWQHPDGPESSILGKETFPVIHVSWYDANAYAKWAGKSLPTEFQWEAAARGQSLRGDFPWPLDSKLQAHQLANLWQGEFPLRDQSLDEYHGIAPVASFPASEHGIFDLAGNVAEWTSSFYAEDSYALIGEVDPSGASRGEMRVTRGGSWLSSDQTGVSEATVWYRGKLTPETSTNFTGFRCVSRDEPSR
ncbi:Serine/threonine-protein kinase pkn1 [Bremerella volcania]|uniref:Serine/threonine-protein kinase pkn1 n=1 Tax=Bremerella volcania TaxID=2527984 RepID=A0A518CED9_9BACT|nr:formylglycine-generating enzyme family protein [Bremerella volcania]QDU77595.1 Serine/threonine-protein kinase pkn1 [Bremerella volcania]